MSDDLMTVGDAVVRLTEMLECQVGGAGIRAVLYPTDARAIRVVLAALAESGKDRARLDWLNEDNQRVEEVFGATVRAECGGDVRAIIDAETFAEAEFVAQVAALAEQETRDA